jgi:hypothetical protein
MFGREAIEGGRFTSGARPVGAQPGAGEDGSAEE